MRKGLILALLLVSGLMVAGCSCGPNHLSRTVDDWQNNYYVEKPVITMLLSDVVPAFPLLKMGAGLVDVVALNPVRFWSKDAWAGEGGGTAFIHENPTGEPLDWFED